MYWTAGVGTVVTEVAATVGRGLLATGGASGIGAAAGGGGEGFTLGSRVSMSDQDAAAASSED